MDLQLIQNRIFTLRGHRVMLDFHLAEMCQVENRALKQVVRRNIRRSLDVYQAINFLLSPNGQRKVVKGFRDEKYN